jgi:hypothetical protein
VTRLWVFALCLLMCAAPAFAQMHHYTVENPAAKKEPAAKEEKSAGSAVEKNGAESAPEKNSAESAPEKASGGSFTVTPVAECFGKMKPGEANEIRRNFDSPWQECQRRLRAREAEEKAKAAESAKDAKKEAPGPAHEEKALKPVK